MNKQKIILPSILIFITFSILITLGFWQLNRAEEKRIIEKTIVRLNKQPAELVKELNTIENKEYQQVLLRGNFDTSKQFIFDNQTVKGNAGYYVLLPLVLEDKKAILVNLGFLPWNNNRNNIVSIKNLTTKTVTIKATLSKPIKRVELKQQQLTKNFPVLIQAIDIEKLSNLSGYNIIPMIALLDINEKYGFYRQWKPFYGSVDKHIGYAIQWFLMAIALIIIAIRIFIKYKNKT